ncbi:hypothetical protein F8M41_026048 [Gigaspora margarita]|uniref:Uncharacterized protein n=1 Tax=Gigaspora margarita TaxID=4874 RepID=A0A8H4ABC1_GIGMA|nr:hypothetical protein F8M41_026048 [Gigaspora margarita]
MTRKKIYKKVKKFGDVEDIIFPIEKEKNIEGPEKLSENETDESENQNEKGDSDSYENNQIDIDKSEIDSIEDRSKNKNSVKNKNNILLEDIVLFIHNISFEAIEEELSDMSVVSSSILSFNYLIHYRG